MDFKTELQTNNNNLQSMLGAVQNLDNNNSPDTCTVFLTLSEAKSGITMHCSVFEDGAVAYTTGYTDSTSDNVIIENVIMNSIILIELPDTETTMSGGEVLYDLCSTYAVFVTRAVESKLNDSGWLVLSVE